MQFAQVRLVNNILLCSPAVPAELSMNGCKALYNVYFFLMLIL